MTDITDKDARIRALEEDCARLEKEKQARDSDLAQFRLMSDALQANVKPSKAIDDFKKIMDNDFMKFANEESSCPDEAQVYLKLQQVYSDLLLIAGLPALYSKNVGAIGGGFSSGKSSFINSFMKNSTVKLPVGIKPVTAIPSYIAYSEKSEIKGYSNKGANFPMSIETYMSLSHENLKNVVFDLKSVIPYITVSCPLDKELLGNICLIDTPGYNAAAAGTSEADRRTAVEAITDAHFLIWLVGLDADGTIGRSDFEFLKDLPFGKDSEHELYIVLSKAELKTENIIENIIDKVSDSLDDNNLEYAGICAYSANTKKLITSRKMDI
jgi:GTPase SAR1 family protein